MARSVNIAFNFMTSDAVNDVNKLTQTLRQMNKEVKKLEKPIKVEIASKDSESKLKALEERIIRLGQVTEETGKKVGNIGALMGLEYLANMTKPLINNFIDGFMKLENAIYSLKVVAGEQAPPIIRLRQEMLQLASTTSFTAVQITEALDSVMRMGLTYNDAMNMVKASSDLALASGESIGDAVNIMNKIVVALKVNTENATQVTESLHSVAVGTATDLAGLGSSAKQWVGAMSTLTNTTNKSGNELDEYRVKLVEIGNGLSGILANMGRAPEQQGTTIREFLTKMVKADKSAEEMLDANLKRNNVRVDENMKVIKDTLTGGTEVTSGFISNLMKRDAEEAINLMSTLVKGGLVDLETMIKVFNGRYGLIVSSMLMKLNGNIDAYNERLREMTNLTEDAGLQAENLNMKFANFRNNLANFFSSGQTWFKTFSGGVLDLANSFLSLSNSSNGFLRFIGLVNEGTLSFVTTLGLGTIGIVGLIATIKTLALTVAPAIASLGTLAIAIPTIGIWTVPIWAVVGAVVALTVGIVALVSNIGLTKQGMSELDVAFLKTSNSLEKLNLDLEVNRKLLKDAVALDMTSFYGGMEGLISSIESPLKNVINEIDELNAKLQEKTPDFVISDTLLDKKAKAIKDLGKSYEELSIRVQDNFGKALEDLNYEELKSFITQGTRDVMELNKKSREMFGKNTTALTKEELSKVTAEYDKLNKGAENYIQINNSTKKKLTDLLNVVSEIRDSENKHLEKSIELENQKRMAVAETLSTLDNEIFSKYTELLSSMDFKNVESMLNYLKEGGEVGVTLAEKLVSSAESLNIKLTTTLLKNKDSLAIMMGVISAQDKINQLKQKETKIIEGNSKVQALVNEGLSSNLAMQMYSKNQGKFDVTQQEIKKLNELIKLAQSQIKVASTSGSKTKTTKNLYDILGITNDYELALQKIADLGQSELDTIKAKKNELLEMYEINRLNSEYEIEAKAKEVGVYSKLNNKLALRNKLQDEIRDSNEKFMNTKMTTEQETALKNKEELAKLLDKYLADEINKNRELKELEYERMNAIRTMMSDVASRKVSYIEVLKFEKDILDFNLENLKLNKDFKATQDYELKLLQEKYKLELDLLDVKNQQLKATLGVSQGGEVEVEKSKFKSAITFGQSSDEVYLLQKHLLEKAKGMKDSKGRQIDLGFTTPTGNFREKTLEALKKVYGVEEVGQELYDSIFGKVKIKEFVTKDVGEINVQSLKKEIEEMQKNKNMDETTQNIYNDKLALLQNELDKLALKANLENSILESYKSNLESRLKGEDKISKLQYEQELTGYKIFNLFKSEEDSYKTQTKNAKDILQARVDALNLSEQTLQASISEVMARTDISNEAKELYKTQAKSLVETTNATEKAEIELETWKLITEEKQRIYNLDKERYSSGLNYLESISKGETISFDISSVREKAINSLIKKTSFGTEMKGSDYGNIGAYSLGILNNFMQTEMASKSKALDYESKILDLRLQGATTEEEKLEIQRQQLELQKQQIDLAYKQQTSFLGMSGSTGSALSGAFSALAGKNLSKLSSGDWVGAGIGMVSGILGAKSAKKDAEEQKRQLEMQAKMTEYLANVSKYSEQSNKALQSMASNASKIGLLSASEKFQREMQANPNILKGIGGAGSESGSVYTGEHDLKWVKGKGFRQVERWETVLRTASYDLQSFGVKALADINEAMEIKATRARIEEELLRQKSLITSSTTAEQLQAKANVEALEQMLTTYNNTFSSIEIMSKHIFKQAFGGNLVEILGEDSKTIVDYYADFSDVIASQFDNMISDITGSMLISGQSVAKRFMDGFVNIFVRNNSQIKAVTDNMTKLFETIGNQVAKSGSSNISSVVGANMAEIIKNVNDYKVAMELATKTSDEFVNVFIQNGGALSDITSSMSSGMKSIYDNLKSALTGGDITSLGSNIATNLVDSIATKLMDSKMTQAFQNLYSSFSQAMTDSTLSNLGSLFSSMSSTKIAMESQQAKLNAIKDLFSSEVSYSSNEAVSYVSGSTKSQVNNYYITSNVTSDYMFADDPASVERLSNIIANDVSDIIKNKKS